MHGKPTPDPKHATAAFPAGAFALDDHQLLEITGPDALAFAQAQFMSDLARLEDGQWQWSGLLNPKGRVIALFALLRLEADRFWLVLPDVAAAELAGVLIRYRFRSRVEIRPLEDRAVAGSFATDVPATPGHGPHCGVGSDGLLALDFSGDTPRQLLIGTGSPAADADAAARWRLQDLRHGLPRLGPEQREAYTPQMLGLDRLEAYSVRKGCYPGQEVVSRTHFLGQARRGPVRLSAAAPLQPGQVLMVDEHEVGRLACVAADGVRCEAIAVASLPLPAGRLHVAGTEVEALALQDGLARR